MVDDDALSVGSDMSPTFALRAKDLEIARLKIVIESYAESCAAAAREIAALRDELASATRHMELAEAAWLRETSGNWPTALAEKQDTTPARNSTPPECSIPPEWMSRPFWVDPPAGHRYGFPRLYDPRKDGDMTAWMTAHGYPESKAKGAICTFTAEPESPADIPVTE